MNAAKALTQEKNMSTNNLTFYHHEESKSVGLIMTKGCEAFRELFRRKFGEIPEAWKLCLNVVTLLL